jgi:thioredoxin 1
MDDNTNSKGQSSIVNALVIVAVLALVGGVAWQKMRGSSETEPTADPRPATKVVSTAATGPVETASPAEVPTPADPGQVTSAPAVASKLPRLLDLGAEKCIACQKMAPILEELKVEYEGRAVVDFINVWKNTEAAQEYGIAAIPTQIFFDRDGKEVWRHVGFLSKEDIVAKFVELGVK